MRGSVMFTLSRVGANVPYRTIARYRAWTPAPVDRAFRRAASLAAPGRVCHVASLHRTPPARIRDNRLGGSHHRPVHDVSPGVRSQQPYIAPWPASFLDDALVTPGSACHNDSRHGLDRVGSMEVAHGTDWDSWSWCGVVAGEDGG